MAAFSGSGARRIGMWNVLQAQDAEKRAADLIGTGKSDALLSLGRNFDQARDDLNTQYTGAIDRLNPYAEAGTKALGVYQGSIGLGGDAARDAAVAAFREAPGYRYSVDQASDAIARKASATGALASGNTLAAISDRAQNIADQGYKDWQGQVLGVSDRGQQAAGVQSGIQAQLGSSLATLGQNLGRSEADVHSGFTNMGVGNIWNSANSQANSLTNAQKQAQDNVNSGYSFGANLVGSGLNLLSLPMGGGTSLGGSLLRLGRSA